MINIIGQIFGTSGYDIHTRYLARALCKVTDTRLSIQAVPHWETMLNDNELEMVKKQPVDDEINLIITNPLFWRLNTNAKRNWAFLVWEGTTIPKCYLEECLNPEIEYIFVPSVHTKEAVESAWQEYMKSEVYKIKIKEWKIGNVEVQPLKKIKIMPHGVDTNLFYPTKKPKQFTFIANKGFRNLEDRGGIQYLIRAYFEEFTDKDDVNLMLKINPAYGIPDLNKLIAKISPRTENLPLLNIDIMNYPYEKMVNLYNKGTVFVSPTRAEAYNLPCIEAMACGLPVITTNFGGQTDYCSDETGWIIGGELEEVKHEVMYEGIKWLTPDIKSLRKALREAYTQSESVISKGQKALEIAKLNSWDNTAIKIAELI